MNYSIEDQEMAETGRESEAPPANGIDSGGGDALQTPELILILLLIGVAAAGFCILYWPLIDMMRRRVFENR